MRSFLLLFQNREKGPELKKTDRRVDRAAVNPPREWCTVELNEQHCEVWTHAVLVHTNVKQLI